MSDILHIDHVNATYLKLSCDNLGIIGEISQFFIFEAAGAKYHPLVINHMWDGMIHLLNQFNHNIYVGLLPHIIKFCDDRGYEYTISQNLYELIAKNSDFDASQYIKTLGIKTIIPHNYQIGAIEHNIRNKRCLCISPTSSGKSFYMYCMIRWYLENLKRKVLIIVPLVDLVTQLSMEFKEYSDFDIEKDIHVIYEGQSKKSDKRIFVSTWQSLYKMPKKYFEQFDAIIFDECHETLIGKSSKGIADKCTNAEYRVGLTGTIGQAKLNKLTMEGVTGEFLQVITTKELMDKGYVSKLKIKCVILKYSNQIRFANRNLDYNAEKKYISELPMRNKIIARLAEGIKKENVLILVKYLNHIELLKEELKNSKKTIFIITGDTDNDERLKNKIATEKLEDVIIIATEKVFSTGISVKNLQNLIIAIGGKSSIRLLQSIGRLLRLDGKNNTCTLYDFVDDFSYKNKKNYLLNHFFERIKIYTSEKFEFNLLNMEIK